MYNQKEILELPYPVLDIYGIPIATRSSKLPRLQAFQSIKVSLLWIGLQEFRLISLKFSLECHLPPQSGLKATLTNHLWTSLTQSTKCAFTMRKSRLGKGHPCYHNKFSYKETFYTSTKYIMDLVHSKKRLSFHQINYEMTNAKDGMELEKYTYFQIASTRTP